MNLATSNYLPGDPRLIDQIVYELKSQGIFDQFRKECIADVDTKPAYQNLSQRVEGSVMNFLKLQTFSEDINKNQLREQLRKNISESGFLETGVERIVDQVVNPKINTVFLPKVEDVVYRFLGIEKPNQEVKQDVKVEDLLPTDLEAISPESVQDHSLNSATEKKEESIETNDNSLNSSNTKTEEDESPPFELLEENTKFSVHEENSIDSHLSGISGLASHESSHSTEIKDNINSLNVADVTQNSLNSEGNLSVNLPEEDIKMEISEESNILESIETKLENNITVENNGITENQTNDTEAKDNEDAKEQITEKIESISNENHSVVDQKTVDKKEIVDKKNEEKKISDSRNNSKRSHDKHKSSRGDKDRKDDSGKRSRSKSDSKSKDSKSSSKHSSSSKDKDKRDSRNGKDRVEVPEKDKQMKKEEKERDRSKDKNSKIKEKDREKLEKDKVGKEKEKSDKEKSHKDKERSEKSRSEKEKGKSEKDKEKVDKDKLDKEKSEKEKSSSSKHNKERSSSSSKKDSSSKDKDRDKSSSNKDKISSSSKHKESTTKDKDSSKSSKDKPKSSSSNSRDKDKEKKDSKSRSTDKHKRSDKDKSSHHDKSSSRKDKEKKSVDDHYSLKDKKSERRSTDRDSNDGSSKMSRNGSFTETSSLSFKGSSKESSEVFSSGSGDTSNSDKVEDNSTEPVMAAANINAVMQVELEAPIKYFKPKFASNIHEAMKIMKIRKQLAKLERQNQLALVHVQTLSQGESNKKQNSKEPLVELGKSLQIPLKPEEKQREKLEVSEIVPPVSKTTTESGTVNEVTKPLAKMEESPMLKSQDLSMESFEALEARLAQEMSNVNYNMYGEEDDNYEYGSINFSPVKKQKMKHEPKNNLKKILFGTSEVYTENNGEIELIVPKKSTEDVDLTKSEVERSDLKIEKLETQEHNEVSTKLMVTVEPNKDVGCGTEPLTVEPKKDVGCGAKPPDSKGNLEHVNNVQEFREDHKILSEPLKESIKDVLTHNELKHKDEESSNKKENSTSLYENPEEETHNELKHKDEESSNKKENSTLYENPEEKTRNELKDEESYNKKENSISLYENPDEKTHNELKHKDEENSNKKENSISLYDNPEEFRGFNEVDRDCSRAIKFTQMIFEMKKNIGKKINGKTNAQIDISKTANISSPRKRGISLGTTIKEVKNMSSTLQDLLQKNGKKLLIKVDHIESDLPSKTLVRFQDMEDHNVNKINIGIWERTNKNEIEKECELEKKKTLNTKEINQNTPVDEKTDGIVILSASNKNGIIDQNSSSQKGVVKWENDDSPCYYFDKPNSDSEKRMQTLNDRIKSLEKAVQVQSLQIQNNIPKVAKRGRKRKTQSTENNNSISSPEKPESKKRHLAEANPIDGNLCNTDVTPDQNFSLPLSPADSEKSEEQKKEEAITVRPKRSGRVSNSKRYSSDDLYKPRPILSCSSTRRRGAKPEENKH